MNHCDKCEYLLCRCPSPKKEPKMKPVKEPNLIKSISELRNLIIFCKEQKVKQLKLGDIEFQLSELDFIQEHNNSTLKNNVNPLNTDTLTDTDQETPINEDPLLFWSSNQP